MVSLAKFFSIVVMLINETHLNNSLQLTIFGYDLLTVNHPSNHLRGCAAILARSHWQ